MQLRRWALPLLGLAIPTEAHQVLEPQNRALSIVSRNADQCAIDSEFPKSRPASAFVGHALLEAISALTPFDSFTGVVLQSTNSDWWEWFVNGNAQNDWNRMAQWTLWGLTSISAGVLWLLTAIFIIMPLLWCRCCRKCMCKDAEKRRRTGTVCNHVTFWICWVLAFFMVVAQIYYAAWTQYDFDKAKQCSAATTYTTIRRLQSELSIHDLLVDVSNAEAVLADPHSAAETTRARAVDYLEEAWLPLSSFSAAWAGETLRWEGVESQWDLTYNGNPFRVESVPDLTGLFNALTDSSVSVASIETSALTNVSPALDSSKSVVAPESPDTRGNPAEARILADITGKLFFSPLIQYLDEYTYGWDWWFFMSILIATSLPAVGLALTLTIFIYWCTTKADMKTQAKSGVRRLAGFTLFGLCFWGILLFIFGGGFLGIMYAPSDVCRQTTGVSFRTADHFRSLLGIDISQDQVDTCLAGRDSGSLLPALSNTDQSLLLGAAASMDFATDAALSKAVASLDFSSIQLAPTVPTTFAGVAIDASHPHLDTVFRTGFTVDDYILDAVAAAALSTSSSDPSGWTTFLSSTDRLPGLQRLVDALNGLGDCNVCIADRCDSSQTELTLQVWPQESQTPDLKTADAASMAAWLLGSTPLSQYLASCSPVRSTTTMTQFEEFWASVYVLVIRLAATGDQWRVPGISGNNVLGPLFWLPTFQQGLTTSYSRVDFETWSSDVQSKMAPIGAIWADHTSLQDTLNQAMAGSSVFNTVLEDYGALQTSLNCRTLLRATASVAQQFCNRLGGDLGALATLSVWLAVLHFIAFCILLAWWIPRRRFADKLKKDEIPGDAESPATPTEVAQTGVSEEDFFRSCETGNKGAAAKAATAYPPNSVADPYYMNTPLHLAAYYGHTDICQDLCEKGWNPNAFNFKRHTPFTACVSNLYLPTDVKIATLTVLKNHGAWVDVYTGVGDTPLMIASRANEREIVALLLEWDANPLNRDQEYQWSSLRLAQSANNVEVYEMLREASPRHQKPSHRFEG